MLRTLLFGMVALVASTATAQEPPAGSTANAPPRGVIGFVDGGLSALRFERRFDETGEGVKMDEVRGVHLAGGLRFPGGFALRARVVGASQDDYEDCAGYGVCTTVPDDFELGEVRVEALYSPNPQETFSVEVGAGLASLDAEIEGATPGLGAAGLAFGGSLAWRPNHRARVEGGAALLLMRDDIYDDAMLGSELRLDGFLTFGALDLGAGLRGLRVAREEENDRTDTLSLGELRLTVGGRFGS